MKKRQFYNVLIDGSNNPVTINFLTSNLTVECGADYPDAFERVESAHLFLKVSNSLVLTSIIRNSLDSVVFRDEGVTCQIDSDNYIEFDLTHVFQTHPESLSISFSLTINAFGTSIISPLDSFLEVELSNASDYLDKQKLVSHNIGSAYSFKQDIVSFQCYLERQLFTNTFATPCLLHYDYVHSSDSVFSFFPKGWKINLLERLVDISLSSITLIDSNFNYRVFRVTNETSLFLDSSGSGELLKNNGDSFLLFSPLNERCKRFKTNGFIEEVSFNPTDKILFHYENNSITITDFLGNSIVVSNGQSSISITCSSIASQTFSLFKNNSGLLTSLSFVSSLENNTIVSDSFTYLSSNRLTNIVTFDGYNCLLERDDYNDFSFHLYYGQTFLQGYSLYKTPNRVRKTNLRNGVAYFYDYNEDHTIIAQGEYTGQINSNDVFSYMDDFLSYISPGTDVSKKIPLFHSDQIDGEYASGDITFSVAESSMATLNKLIYLKAENAIDDGTYLFIGKITQNKGMPSYGKAEVRGLYIFKTWFENNTETTDSNPSAAFHHFGEQYVAAIISLNHGTDNILKIVLGRNFGSYELSNLHLIRINKCFSGIIYGTAVSTYQNTTSLDNLLSDLTTSLLYEHAPTNKYYPVSSIDLVASQISRIKVGYVKYFFTNQLKNVFVFFFPGSNKNLHDSNNNSIQFELTDFGFISKDKKNNVYLKVIYPVGNNVDRYKMMINRIHGSSNIDSYAIININNGKIIEESDYSDVLTTYSYDTNNHNLVSISKSASNLPNIYRTFSYDSLNRLTGETAKIGNQSATTSYQYVGGLNVVNQIIDGEDNQIFASYSPRYEYQKSISRPITTNDTAFVTTSRLVNLKPDTYAIDGGHFSFNYDTNRNEVSMISFSNDVSPVIDNNLISITRTYNSGGSKNIKYQTPNSFTYFQFFDKYNRPTLKMIGPSILLFSYDSSYSDGKLSQIYDSWGNNGETTHFTYNDDKQLVTCVINGYINTTRNYTYNSFGNVQSFKESITGSSKTDFDRTSVQGVYNYDSIKGYTSSIVLTITKTVLDISTVSQVRSFDKFDRLSYYYTIIGTKTLGFDSISYFSLANNETSLEVSSVTFKQGGTTSYTYDKVGNILSISSTNTCSQSVSYQYDATYRLTKETHSSENYYIDYTYDNNGNILSAVKKDNSNNVISTDTFTYHTQYINRLLTYNGVTITYDSFWNPLTLDGATLTYYRGNLLNTYTKNSITTTYKYNGFGIRTYKQVGDVDHYYIVDGGRITREITEEQNSPYDKHYFVYLYGLTGILGFIYDGDKYYYEKDLQNTIIGIYKKTLTSLTLVAKYVYDAYGNHKVLDSSGVENTSSTFIGNINPFRYRSYYFDKETGFYYCQSRYYVPYLRRWLTLDDLSYLNNKDAYGCNLFAYCNDNPVMFSDETGHMSGLLIAIIVGAAIGGTIGGIWAGIQGVNNGLSGWELAGSIGIGILTGSISGAVSGYLSYASLPFILALGISGTVGAVTGAGSEALTQLLFDKEISSYKRILASAFVGWASGTLSSLIGDELASKSPWSQEIRDIIFNIVDEVIWSNVPDRIMQLEEGITDYE